MSNIKGERSIMIQADTRAIYDYICNFTRHTEWNYQPTEITKITEGPIAVGSVFRAKELPPGNAPWFVARIMLPFMAKLTGFQGYTEAEITAMEPARRLAWKAVAPARKGYMMKAEWEILLEPRGEATKVTQRYHFMPGLKFMERQSEGMTRQIGEEVATNLEALKGTLEDQFVNHRHPA
jgi:hypothetical protein